MSLLIDASGRFCLLNRRLLSNGIGAIERVDRFRSSAKGELAMPFTGIAEPEQLSMLGQALEEYCLTHGISDVQGRDDAAWLIRSAYTNGCGRRLRRKSAAKLRRFTPLMRRAISAVSGTWANTPGTAGRYASLRIKCC